MRARFWSVSFLCCLAGSPIVLGQAAPAPQPVSPSPSSPGSQGPRITLGQAVAEALAKNPNLLMMREHVSATRAQQITAGLRQNPTLTLTGQGVTLPEVANDGGNPFYYSANVSRLFERGRKRQLRLEGATATADQTESQMHDQERQVALQVRQAFTNLLIAREARGIADENLADYRKTLDLSQARLDAGDITKTDFERIDLQLAQFESDADNAALNYQQASAQLQVLFGVQKPDLTLQVDGTLAVPEVTLTMAEAEAIALASRPDVAAAQQGLRASQANLRLAIADGTADPTISAEYERSGPDNTVGGTITIPLRFFDRNQGEKERTRFEVRSSEFGVTAVRNQVVSDVDQAWLALDIARRLASRYNGHYLAEAAHVRDNLQFSYRNGNTTLLDYLSALRDYRAINLAGSPGKRAGMAGAPSTEFYNREGHRSMNVTITKFFLLAGAGAALISGCRKAPPPSEAEQQANAGLETTVAHLQQSTEYLEVPAHVMADPSKTVRIYPPLSGRIFGLRVLPGQDVKKGDAIAMLQSSDVAAARSDFEKARIEVLRADRALARGKLLYEHEVLSQADYYELQAVDQVAHSEQERARQRINELGFAETGISDTVAVRSPISGAVLDIGTASGEMQRSLDNAAAIATIANLDTIWVSGDVFERDLAVLQTGRPVDVSLPAYPELRLTGKIANISDALDPNTHTLKLRVVMDNAKHMLKPEMFATIRVAEGVRRAYVLPESAVLHEGEKTSVFVQNAAGKYDQRSGRRGGAQLRAWRNKAGRGAERSE